MKYVVIPQGSTCQHNRHLMYLAKDDADGSDNDKDSLNMFLSSWLAETLFLQSGNNVIIYFVIHIPCRGLIQ